MDTPAPGMASTDYTDYTDFTFFAVRFRAMAQLHPGLGTDPIFPTEIGAWPRSGGQESDGERPHSP